MLQSAIQRVTSCEPTVCDLRANELRVVSQRVAGLSHRELKSHEPTTLRVATVACQQACELQAQGPMSYESVS